MSDPAREADVSAAVPKRAGAATVIGRIVFCLAVAAALAAVVFVWVLPGPPGGPDVAASKSLAKARVAGHDAVLVAYEDWGGARSRALVGAFDLGTGELLWATKVDAVASNSRFVAVGRRYVYVTADFGLFALDLNTGALAGGKELGFSGVHALTTFAYLPEQNVIAAGPTMANGDDPVQTVALDAVKVTGADAATSAAFRCALDSICRGDRPDPDDTDPGPVTSAGGRTVRVVEHRYDHLPPVSWLVGGEHRTSDELRITDADGSHRTIVLGRHGWFGRLR